jgi:cation:H+ antiporter
MRLAEDLRERCAVWHRASHACWPSTFREGSLRPLSFRTLRGYRVRPKPDLTERMGIVDLIPALLAIAGGFVLLVWSADRFVDGAAATAGHAGMPSLVIGMVIVGFGTSAPEMVVSAMAALDGNPDLALGNALGSNIVNTGLVLGVTALVAPIVVHSKIIRRELPLLFGIGLAAGVLFWDGALTRPESLLLLLGFFALIGWSLVAALRGHGDALEAETVQELESHAMTLGRAIFWLVAGLVLLIVSSRVLVWGAVNVAQALGVSDLVIGLTIVALGTSLPELAASVMAARKGEHDIALGNLVGSNMFNLLAVVGIAGVITPMPTLAPAILTRDWPVMMALIAVLFVMAYGFRGQGRINRLEGALLVLAFAAYNIWLVASVMAG